MSIKTSNRAGDGGLIKVETSSAQDSGNININVAPSVAGQSNIGVRVAGSIDGNSGGHIKIRSGDSDTGVGGNMLLGTGTARHETISRLDSPPTSDIHDTLYMVNMSKCASFLTFTRTVRSKHRQIPVGQNFAAHFVCFPYSD